MDIGSKGVSKRMNMLHRVRQFGYVAYNFKRKNASIILPNMHMIM